METTSSLTARVSLFPQLSFHYGLSFDELLHMPAWAIDLYVKQLPRLLAEQHQAAIEAASFPNFDRQTQRSVQRRLERLISSGRVQEAAKIDVVGNPDTGETQGANPLAGMVGVEIVD